MLYFQEKKDSAKCIFLVPDLEKMGLPFLNLKYIQDQRKKNFKMYVPESLTKKSLGVPRNIANRILYYKCKMNKDVQFPRNKNLQNISP